MVQFFSAVGHLDEFRLRLLVLYYNLVKQIPNNELLAACYHELPLLNFNFLVHFNEGAACLAQSYTDIFDHEAFQSMVEADHEVAAHDVSITVQLNVAPLLYLGVFHLFCVLEELFAAKVCAPIIFRIGLLLPAIIDLFAYKSFLVKMYSLLLDRAARSTDCSQNQSVTIRDIIIKHLEVN